MSLATVSSRASPAPWTLCYPVLGRRPSLSSSGSGHNAWVSNSVPAFPTLTLAEPTMLAVVVAGFLIVCLSVLASSHKLTSCSPSPSSFFGSMQSQFYSFCINSLMSLTSLPYISNTLPSVSLHMLSMLYLGTPYVPTSGNGLTVLQSVLPITGSLCGPNSDHRRHCANQRGP